MRKRYRNRFARRPSGLAERMAEVERRRRARCPSPSHVDILDEAGRVKPTLIFVRDGDQMLCQTCAREKEEIRGNGLVNMQ